MCPLPCVTRARPSDLLPRSAPPLSLCAQEEFMELCAMVNDGAPVYPGNFKTALESFGGSFPSAVWAQFGSCSPTRPRRCQRRWPDRLRRVPSSQQVRPPSSAILCRAAATVVCTLTSPCMSMCVPSARRFPLVLFPAFRLQDAIQAATLGTFSCACRRLHHHHHRSLVMRAHE